MKKALFISAATLVQTTEAEPRGCHVFAPAVFRCLYYIRKNMDFDLVLFDNGHLLKEQSGTAISKAFSNEGISFANIAEIRDGSGTAFSITEKYELAESFVIANRAAFLNGWPENIKRIIISGERGEENCIYPPPAVIYAADWTKVIEALSFEVRTVYRERITNESRITVRINLDGAGEDRIKTGIGFFDHLLSQLARHSGINLEVNAEGDLHVDEHHTIEDTAITIGEAFYVALGSKRGMERYGFALPMDDCMAQVLVDFGGRPWLVWDVSFKREKIGDMPTEMFMHFFKSFSDAAKCNLHITAEGINEHHKIEAVFKAAAKAFRMAVRRDVFEYKLPTTKGMI